MIPASFTTFPHLSSSDTINYDSKISLPQVGERVFERSVRIVADAEQAARDVEDLSRGSHGLIRISTAIIFGRMHLLLAAGCFLLAVSDFLMLNPSIEIEVTLSERFADVVARRLSPAQCMVSGFARRHRPAGCAANTEGSAGLQLLGVRPPQRG